MDILLHEIYRLVLGNEVYQYIDVPIEIKYFYENCGDAAMATKSNLGLVEDSIPHKYFDSTADAFLVLNNIIKTDKNYLFGLVINYRTKRYYYDKEDVNQCYWQRRLEHIIFMAEGIKVCDLSIIPI